MKTYALVDCNSFYASCELSFRPDIWGKPVVVLSNNDGCVIARNRQAKAIGIKMGEVVHLRKDFYSKQKVSVFSANFSLYGSISARVMTILQNQVIEMEIYSIDEAFLDITEISNPIDFCRYLRRLIFKLVGIPVSVGIGSTKTLAKLANRVAKKYDNLRGVFYLEKDSQIGEAVFRQTLVSEIWGVGKKHTERLNKMGISTVADFAGFSQNWVLKNMAVTGLRTHQELNGFPCIALEDVVPEKKSIMVSRSFGMPLTAKSDIEEALATHTNMACRKLRELDFDVNAIRVILQTNPFKQNEKQYHNSLSIRLPCATQNTLQIAKYANFLLGKIFREGYIYKRTGIMLYDFSPKNSKQLTLEQSETNLKEQDLLMKTIDQIHTKYGLQSLKIASQGTSGKFEMRQAMKSQRYTTSFEEILKVRI